jgi:hypothetical protein
VYKKNLEKHYYITTTRDLLDTVKALDIIDNKTVKVCINVKKRDKYLEDKVTVINLLFRSLSNNN